MGPLTIFFVLIVSLAGVSAADPIDGLEFQSESVATTEFVTSGMINPAGLSFYSASGIRYTHSFTDSTYGGDDALLIGSRRGFFGLEWLKHTSNQFRRKYTMAIGDRMAKNLYMGISYSWFGGSIDSYKKMKNWKIGFLYRPRTFMALGLVADRLNEPKFDTFKLKRLYTPGIAIRPFGNKFTFSADARWLEGDDINKLSGSFRFAAGPFRGVNFSADYRAEGSWRIGLVFDFDRTRIGMQGRLDNSQKYYGGSYFLETGEMRYSSFLKRQSKRGTISLSGTLSEEPGSRVFFAPPKNSLLRTVTALRKGLNDDRIGELLLKIDNSRMSFAAAQEIREALVEYRKKGKTVTVYLENSGNLSYYIASAADKIIMAPTSYLMLKGLAFSATFYKGTMDKLGINATVIRTGPHKTGANAYVEKDLTPEAEEQMSWLIDDMYSQIVDGISTGRKLLPETVRNLIDNGPYTARDALSAGVIDELRYYDSVVSPENDTSGMVDLLSFYDIDDYNPRWSEPQKVAVVYADGVIVEGSSGNGLLEGKLLGGRTLANTIESVRTDSKIKAVVLRVNSPGGDVFGSDKIYRELELLKGKKPLVVSMGGVAASGGYYISAPGDEILASPGTITGSIGVYAGKADFSGFFDKIGINKRTIKRGKHADITSIDRPPTEEEIEFASRQIWQIYNDFVSKVSTWRKMDYDSVDSIGQGRVWTGRQAIRNGLVDSYGGIWDAIERARQKAGIDSEDNLIVEVYPKPKFSLFEWPSLSIADLSVEGLLRESANIGWQMRMPFDLEIEQ